MEVSILQGKNSEFISDIVMNSIRILILINKFEGKQSSKLNIDRIMLYDYYMKFPNTMIGSDNLKIYIRYNFHEYYSFYHWKPDYSNYNKVLRYLISKGLIEREFRNKEFYYLINEKGVEFIKHLNSNYKQTLDVIAEFIKNNVAKKKDNEIEREILNRTNITNRFRGENNGEEI